MKNIKVSNMQSSRGNDVPNQFIIHAEDGTYFRSYSSLIAFRSDDGKIVLDEKTWDYSATTGKYRDQFLGEGIADTRQKIKAGIYELADLN